MDGISPNFIYVFLLARSWMEFYRSVIVMDLDCYFYNMKCVIARLLSDFLDSISQRRVGQTCSHFMCIVKRVADN